jgi:hypothetical protein
MLYFVTFINDYKKHILVTFMKTKSQDLEEFKTFKGVAKTFTWHKLEILWIDNGVEYNSINFHMYYSNHGIIHQFSKPYSLGSKNIIKKETNHYVRLQIVFFIKAIFKWCCGMKQSINMVFVQHASNRVVEELDTWTNIYWNPNTICVSFAQFLVFKYLFTYLNINKVKWIPKQQNVYSLDGMKPQKDFVAII